MAKIKLKFNTIVIIKYINTYFILRVFLSLAYTGNNIEYQGNIFFHVTYSSVV